MDELLKLAIKITIEQGFGSVSTIQRKMRLGYNDAEKMMLRMEDLGVISSKSGTKPRQLLVHSIEEAEKLEKRKD
jgi:S-DNA-T family DNA segregation ATPase FtsK/SpoIIIE